MTPRIITLCLALLMGATSAIHARPDESRRSIRLAALRYLMLKHATAPGKERQVYSFYVLRDKEFVSDFSGFNPPVVAYDTNRFNTKGMALEWKSGRAVKVWSVGEPKIEGARASVRVSWYSNGRAAGSHTVFLEERNGAWVATSERLDMISQKEPNQSIEPTGGSRFCQAAFVSPRRLPPVAHARRWP
jgi:hypothetical protein